MSRRPRSSHQCPGTHRTLRTTPCAMWHRLGEPGCRTLSRSMQCDRRRERRDRAGGQHRRPSRGLGQQSAQRRVRAAARCFAVFDRVVAGRRPARWGELAGRGDDGPFQLMATAAAGTRTTPGRAGGPGSPSADRPRTTATVTAITRSGPSRLPARSDHAPAPSRPGRAEQWGEGEQCTDPASGTPAPSCRPLSPPGPGGPSRAAELDESRSSESGVGPAGRGGRRPRAVTGRARVSCGGRCGAGRPGRGGGCRRRRAWSRGRCGPGRRSRPPRRAGRRPPAPTA